jgi:hypothetical protein
MVSPRSAVSAEEKHFKSKVAAGRNENSRRLPFRGMRDQRIRNEN